MRSVDKKDAKPLAEIVRENFSGPFLLRAVKASPHFPEAVKFIPVYEEDFVAKMGIGADESVRIFGVGAFKSKVGKQYNCLCRRRSNASIIEAIPIGYETMADREWRPNPFTPDFELVFKGEGGRYWSKHPKTGQVILPHKEWEMPAPGKDGTIVVPAGTVELRPTCTRAFYMAGPRGTLSSVSHAALDVYEGGNGEKQDFSYAAMFCLFGRWYTAFEVVGNPFAGLFEADTFTLGQITEQAKDACDKLERWAARELLPVLHPDYISGRKFSAATEANILEVADETRHSLVGLAEWFRSWTTFAIQDLQRRKVAGKPLAVKIPAPVGTRKKRTGLLVEKSKAEIATMLYKKPKPPAKPAAKPATATKPAAATTKATTAAVKKPKGKLAPPPAKDGLSTSIGELVANGPDLKALRKAISKEKPKRGGQRQATTKKAAKTAKKATTKKRPAEESLETLIGKGLTREDIAKLAELGVTSRSDLATQTKEGRLPEIAKAAKIPPKRLQKALKAT